MQIKRIKIERPNCNWAHCAFFERSGAHAQLPCDAHAPE